MRFLAAVRRLPPLETAILVAAFAALVWLRVASSNRGGATRALDSFSSYESASGGYRAYYVLLERLGVRVDRFERRLAYLDADVDTLVYVEPYAFDPRAVTPAPSEIAALEAWVRGGGRLLYIGHDDAAAKRGILHLPRTVRAARRAHAPRLAPELAAAGVRRVRFETGYRFARGSAPFRTLIDDGRGPLAVAYSFGRGRVIALVDQALFRNDGIARFDRARLAYALALPGRPDGVVAFDEAAHGFLVSERWWQIVPRGFAIAIGVAVAAILIALAGAAIRFGPPIVPVDRRDRSSADFIDALSSLLERGGALRQAELDAASSATRAIARAVGAREDVAPEEVANRIERADVRDAYRDMLAVTANGSPTERDLVRGVALAQRLRKEFVAHGRHRN